MSGISDAQRLAIYNGKEPYVNAKVCNHCAGNGLIYTVVIIGSGHEINCPSCLGEGFLFTKIKDITNGHI